MIKNLIYWAVHSRLVVVLLAVALHVVRHLLVSSR